MFQTQGVRGKQSPCLQGGDSFEQEVEWMQRWKQSAGNAVRELGRGLRGSTAVRAGRWLGSQFRHGEPGITSRKSVCRGNHGPPRSLRLGGWERLPNGSSFLALSPFPTDSDSGASSVPSPALPAAEAAQGKSLLPTAHSPSRPQSSGLPGH